MAILALKHALIPLSLKLVKQYATDLDLGEHFSYPASALKLTNMELCYVWYDGEVKGIIGGSIGCSPWNPGIRVLQEEIFYVREDSRNGTIGSRLLTTYLKNIETVDAQMYTMKTMVDSPASVDKLYKRFGFNELETTYVRR